MTNTSYQWTLGGTRLEHIKTNPGSDYNWLFLPGGPGMGSEYFYSLTGNLKVPGTLWHVDLPDNGANRRQIDNVGFSSWRDQLLEAVQLFDKVILVGHSFGGMLALTTPGLEEHLQGLVLMNSAPGEWKPALEANAKEKKLPNILGAQTRYGKNPDNEKFRKLIYSFAPYFFSRDAQQKGLIMLEQTPLNHKPFDWGNQIFFPEYQAQWVPENIPTLLIGGDHDYTMPSALFKSDQRFQRDNIKLQEIAGGSHFPWLERSEAVSMVFSDFSASLWEDS